MLRYRVVGSGTPLLLIHGWGVTYGVWQNLEPLLAPYFQLIMIELPGTGAATKVDWGASYYPACAEAIEELRQMLDIEQWAVLAYSTGTRAGEAYLQRYPRHVTRAIFLCPIYLKEQWMLGLSAERLLDSIQPRLANWIMTDWRMYGFVLAFGFNWHKHDYTDEWMNEIEEQSIENLKRMLLELPGTGRAPFNLSPVPTLFVWGRRDALTARPLRPRPNDIFILANHSAPMLAAPRVAEVVLPYLLEGKLVPHKRVRRTLRIHKSERTPSTTQQSGERAQLLKRLRNASLRKVPVSDGYQQETPARGRKKFLRGSERTS